MGLIRPVPSVECARLNELLISGSSVDGRIRDAFATPDLDKVLDVDLVDVVETPRTQIRGGRDQTVDGPGLLRMRLVCFAFRRCPRAPARDMLRASVARRSRSGLGLALRNPSSQASASSAVSKVSTCTAQPIRTRTCHCNAPRQLIDPFGVLPLSMPRHARPPSRS